jgi:hypothetical protein
MESTESATPNKDPRKTGPALREILAPVHAEGRALPDTDKELDALFESAREEVRKQAKE